MFCALSRAPSSSCTFTTHRLLLLHGLASRMGSGKGKDWFFLPGAHVLYCGFALARAMIHAGLFALEDSFEGSLESTLLGVARSGVSYPGRNSSCWLSGAPHWESPLILSPSCPSVQKGLVPSRAAPRHLLHLGLLWVPPEVLASSLLTRFTLCSHIH